jgi:hypothetical protein
LKQFSREKQMKRDTQMKIIFRLGALAGGLLACAPVLAHPGVVAHPPSSGPAHGLVHAMMAAPVLAVGVLVGLVLFWQLIRPGGTAVSGRKYGLKQE